MTRRGCSVREDFLIARDGEAMVASLRAVLRDRDLAGELAANGLRTIRARHTCAHRVDELLAIVAAAWAPARRLQRARLRMNIAFYGSSLLSSYWNGAATYYRGLLRALAALGHEITFYEPDILDRYSHRDIAPPSWCRVVVYPATGDGLRAAVAGAAWPMWS